MQKLKAFTLMELLIGMIISAIVISFCYLSYTIIYKQYLSYKSVKKELVEAMELNAVCSRDIANADKVLFEENKLILLQEQHENVEYHFLETIVLRKNQEVIDTFKLAPVNIVPNYLIHSSGASSLLISLSFDAMVFGEQDHFQFQKLYDAETIVNDEVAHFKNN
jgi:prepilin-type N-terminal cleavage/methylation domain-containing protein